METFNPNTRECETFLMCNECPGESGHFLRPSSCEMINFLAISFRNGFYAVSYSGKCFLNGEISLQLRKSHCYAVIFNERCF